MNKKIVLMGLLCFIIFSALIYPTPHYYTSLKTNGDEYPVKINRITGEAKLLTLNGWMEMDDK